MKITLALLLYVSTLSLAIDRPTTKETILGTNCLWEAFDSFDTNYLAPKGKETYGKFVYDLGYRERQRILVEYFDVWGVKYHYEYRYVTSKLKTKRFEESEEDGDKFTLARKVRAFLKKVEPESYCKEP